MQIILGKTSGFCPGVKNAVEKAQEEVKKSKNRVYCLGELVHNKYVMQKLENCGLITVDKIEDAKGKTIIRAHGVPRRVYDTAEIMKIELKDLTCPKVKHIHDIVEEYSKKDYFILCLGTHKHPEIVGIQGFCNDNFQLIEELEDIDKAIETFKKSKLEKLLIISQTTFSINKFNLITKKIKEKISKEIDLEIKNTICKATELRQQEADRISKNVDLMIVIGGKNSSNTKKLYEISCSNCKNAMFIQSKGDINLDYINQFEKIGIMAGASTPKELIDEVIELLQKKGNKNA